MINWLTDIDWRQPLWLLLVFQPLILWLALRWIKNRTQQNYADEALLPWVKVQNQRSFLQRLFSRDSAYVLAIIGIAIALAGPRIHQENTVGSAEKSLDIMLMFDVSRSMQIKDINPSRIRRATLEALEFLSLSPSAKVGAIVYAARPHLLVPLTSDFTALEFYLKDIDTLELPTQGGDAAAAIRFAHKELNLSTNKKNNNQGIVWFTDGDIEIAQQSNIEEAATEDAAKIFILGLGATEASAIPLKDGTWLEDNGNKVTSKADFEFLEKMAKKWGGEFSSAEDDESDWDIIYRNGILKQLEIAADTDNDNWKELYIWFLFPALLLLTYALFPSLKNLFVLLVLSSIILWSSNVMAEDVFVDSILDGASVYDTEKYGLARAEFIEAVLSAETDNQRATALHNLGNALFKTGEYETAIYLFGDALRYNPKQIDSIYNHKLTLELYQILQRRQQKLEQRRNITRPNPERNALDIPEEIAFLLQNNIHTMEFTLPEIPEEQMNQILEKGLERIRLMESQRKKDPLNTFKQQQINEAKIYLNGLEEQPTLSPNALWKRLFEIEEGFPASLDKPEQVPGIRPW